MRYNRHIDILPPKDIKEKMKKVKCAHCGDEFLSKNLARHSKRKHPNMQVSRDYSAQLLTPSKAKCVICDKLVDKTNLMRHIRTVHDLGDKRRYGILPNPDILKTRQISDYIKLVQRKIFQGIQRGEDQSQRELELQKLNLIKYQIKTSGRKIVFNPRGRDFYNQLKWFIKQLNLSHLFEE